MALKADDGVTVMATAPVMGRSWERWRVPRTEGLDGRKIRFMLDGWQMELLRSGSALLSLRSGAQVLKEESIQHVVDLDLP